MFTHGQQAGHDNQTQPSKDTLFDVDSFSSFLDNHTAQVVSPELHAPAPTTSPHHVSHGDMRALESALESAQRSLQALAGVIGRLGGSTATSQPPMSLDVPQSTVPAHSEQMVVDTGEKVVEGSFDGQHMNGFDGKEYSIPPNYASKSKLVDGDVLKLTITPQGSFVYKQIRPIERRRILATVHQDEQSRDYSAVCDGKQWRILTASVTYYKGLPGDEVVVLVPRDKDSVWGAVENIIKKY